LKRRIHQIEIDLSRSRIRLIEVSLLLSKKVTYFEFSSVQFLRSVMITADDCSYNTLQLVLKSGEVPVEIARFDKVPVTDGSISFRQPITENPQAQALRKELCRMTGIRDFGFLCSFSANPIDMGQP
jgi:hypothetical protein